MYPNSHFASSPWMPGMLPPNMSPMSPLRIPMMSPGVPATMLPRVPVGYPLHTPATSAAGALRHSIVPMPGAMGLSAAHLQSPALHHPALRQMADATLAHVTGPCIRLPQAPGLPPGQVLQPIPLRQPVPFSAGYNGTFPGFLSRPLTSMALTNGAQYGAQYGGLMGRPPLSYPYYRPMGPVPGMVPPRVQTPSYVPPPTSPAIQQQTQAQLSPASPDQSQPQGSQSPSENDASLPRLSAAPSGTTATVSLPGPAEATTTVVNMPLPTPVNGTVVPATVSTTVPARFPQPSLPTATPAAALVGAAYQPSANGIIGASAMGVHLNGVRFPVAGHPPGGILPYSLPQPMGSQLPVGPAGASPVLLAPANIPTANSNLGKRPSSDSSNLPMGDVAEGEPLMKRPKPLSSSVSVVGAPLAR